MEAYNSEYNKCCFNNTVLYHSVALAFTAIRLLQDADIFRMKPTDFQEKNNVRKCFVCMDI